MLKWMKLNRLAVLAIVSTVCMVVAQFPAAVALGVAPGCTSNRPTAITGSVFGYGGQYNNWTVNVFIGIDLLDSSAHKVDVNGNSIGAGYSTTFTINPSLAPPGSPSGSTRTFGPICVASNIKTAWFELYPKDTSGQTQKTYFGGANDQNMPVTTGAANSYGERLPTAHLHGGNTGDLNGYAKYNGHSVAANNLSFRAFPAVAGTSCGVQGFSAGADNIGVSSSQNATYYLIKNLAGGQCGASSQRYKIYATCINACGASKVTKMLPISIANGSRPRLDFAF